MFSVETTPICDLVVKVAILTSKMYYYNYYYYYYCYYINLQRMNEEKLPLKTLKWCPPGRRPGIRRYSRMQEVTTKMRERGISSMEWVDREEL